ncbi:uncharacterized protein LOC129916392 [Episyrphus balteatus]|uniref:uncharacterized protein LOC129916392 n=1 Tax=Episyrphus balteatus TaxID=286459 RepID=UPI0024864097|nr:uncharacterized protein LOC129916392 [Episyrphus balteatus]
MIEHNTQNQCNKKRKSFEGEGLLNKVIDKLPFELHIPSYNYCGPGTKLEERLRRGDKGINQLDEACRLHDIAYSKSSFLSDRHIADKILTEQAWKRFKANDSSTSEKLSGLLVTNMMKAKTKFGMGNCKTKNAIKRTKKTKSKKVCKQNMFKKAISEAKNAIKNNINCCGTTSIANIAVKAAKHVIKNKKKQIQTPRIIPLPKSGGFLPLLAPILAGLSAVGSLTGGAAGVVKALNDVRAAKRQFEENKRHNKTMESVAIQGNGLFLKPYKNGLGLFLNSTNTKN